MYNVLIAEDELLARMGLISSAPWEELGMRVVGSAADGQKAWELYRSQSPDIVLTDLRMPKRSGMELLRMIREHDTRCRVIIVTCMEDFGALHECFRLGVSGYLLKATMTPEELSGQLKRAAEELRELDAGHIPADVPVPPAKPLKPKEAVMLCCGFSGERVSEGQVRSASAVLMERLSRFGLWIAVPRVNRTDYLLEEHAPSCEAMRGLIGETAEYLTSVFGLTLTAVYAPESENTELRSEERAAALLEMPYFTEGDFIMLDASLRASSPKLMGMLRLLREEPAYTGFRDGWRRERTLRHIDALEESFAVSRAVWEDALLALGRDLFAAEGILPNVPAFERLRPQVRASKSAGEALRYLLEAYPKFSPHPLYSSALRATAIRMREHPEESVPLNTLAQSCTLSPNYYAALFKQEVGLSVTEYLARIRLERACGLLTQSDLTVQEVAQACGFADVAYFSRFFKSYTGQPPKRWKLRHQGGAL